MIYSSESDLKKPVLFFKQMFADLWISRQVALRIVIKNIASQYRQTYLGYVWAILPAIFTTSIFVYLNSKNILNIETKETNYVVYVLSGMVLWQVFTDALQAPLKHTSQSMVMLKKIMFPREAIILAGVGEVLINFFIRFLLLIAVLFIYETMPSSNILYIPFTVFSLMILGTLFGLLLLPIGLLYQDISKMLVMITALWFFLTPVIYPLSDKNDSLLIFNPVSSILITGRSLLLNANEIYVLQSFIITSISILVCFCAWIIYRISLPYIIERMGG